MVVISSLCCWMIFFRAPSSSCCCFCRNSCSWGARERRSRERTPGWSCRGTAKSKKDRAQAIQLQLQNNTEHQDVTSSTGAEEGDTQKIMDGDDPQWKWRERERVRKVNSGVWIQIHCFMLDNINIDVHTPFRAQPTLCTIHRQPELYNNTQNRFCLFGWWWIVFYILLYLLDTLLNTIHRIDRIHPCLTETNMD